MPDYSTPSRVDLENIASDFLFAQWEARHRVEVRALAEMIGCATQSGWGRFLQEFAPAELRTGTDGAAALADCIALYRIKHAITPDELASAAADFRLINSDAPIEFADAFLTTMAAVAAEKAALDASNDAVRAAKAGRLALKATS